MKSSGLCEAVPARALALTEGAQAHRHAACSQTIPNAALFISASRLKLPWICPCLSGQQVYRLRNRCNAKSKMVGRLCYLQTVPLNLLCCPSSSSWLGCSLDREGYQIRCAHVCVCVVREALLTEVTLLYWRCDRMLSLRFSKRKKTQKGIIRSGQSEQDGSQWRG